MINFTAFLAEFIIFIFTIALLYHSLKRNGASLTISFFAPLFIFGTLMEELTIRSGMFYYQNLNVYIWHTPLLATFWWSFAYLVRLLYERLIQNKKSILFGVLLHTVIDAFITTPLFIIGGFWVMKNTLFSIYPYIAPAVHFGEVTIFAVYIFSFLRVQKSNNKLIKYLTPFIIMIILTGIVIITAPIFTKITQ